MVNPLTRCVQDYALPPFASMQPSDIGPAIQTAIDELLLDLNSIEDDLGSPEADITWEAVMDRLEIIDDPLDRLWGVVDLLKHVANGPELRVVEAQMQASVAAIHARRAQSAPIYHAMQKLRASEAYTTTFTSEQQVTPPQ
ncbi:Aste57867_18378 [Aphanomyces stellatus]|uniref:Aste57867_18378 protein n=1 Tax=Aphanomyces stellatus TaxID=120398 RepID=A0A485LAJ0_9STRA|nr:hypothetical protein As57867_018316 [Aphanomyces stellatus]VFT95114.1 Aste57867_18378 [Aphanomyces stellatus]